MRTLLRETPLLTPATKLPPPPAPCGNASERPHGIAAAPCWQLFVRVQGLLFRSKQGGSREQCFLAHDPRQRGQRRLVDRQKLELLGGKDARIHPMCSQRPPRTLQCPQQRTAAPATRRRTTQRPVPHLPLRCGTSGAWAPGPKRPQGPKAVRPWPQLRPSESHSRRVTRVES